MVHASAPGWTRRSTLVGWPCKWPESGVLQFCNFRHRRRQHQTENSSLSLHPSLSSPAFFNPTVTPLLFRPLFWCVSANIFVTNCELHACEFMTTFTERVNAFFAVFVSVKLNANIWNISHNAINVYFVSLLAAYATWPKGNWKR